MTSRSRGRAEGAGTSRRLQVQRSQSRDMITIHFSAVGAEDGEEEEELYSPASLSFSSDKPEQDRRRVRPVDSSDELLFEGIDLLAMEVTSASGGAISHIQGPQLSSRPATNPNPSVSSSSSSAAPSSSADHNPPLSGPSPSRSATISSKPFLSLVRSLSTETEATPPTKLHRQLVKSLVKSLSMDTSEEDPEPSPSNQTNSDSRTAPCSPLPSSQEVEMCLDDSRRWLSEVTCEPLQLLNRFRADEGRTVNVSGRPRSLSSSIQELSFDGHMETSYIQNKEQDTMDTQGKLALVLDSCSMSTLARQQFQELRQLYSHDTEMNAGVDAELDRERCKNAAQGIDRSKRKEKWEEKNHVEEEEEETVSRVPHWPLLGLAMLVYGCLVLPLPPYFGGVLLGVAAGFILATFMVWLAAPGYSRGHRRNEGLWNMAPLDIQEPGIFKGWMNEIHNYDPETYHATLTHSVFVRLEGCTLRLSKPNRNVSRRATFNEPKPDVTYVSQKIYDLTDSKIFLMPQNLARKRVWNKKYPICVELARQDGLMSKAPVDEVGPADADRSAGEHTLYLFGRTGREKEEWFRRILLASQLKSEAKKLAGLSMHKSTAQPTHSHSSSQPVVLSHSRTSSRSSLDEVLLLQPLQRELTGGLRQKALLDYSIYMAQYIPSPPGSPTSSSNHSGESSPGTRNKLPSSPSEEGEPVAWVNAFLGRALWDFLRERHWADAVSRKIQMKLSKIRLPYFMNELTLTELDMGISIPKILQASQPTVDHQGLWFDLEMSYNGSFLMTLETKMNLARLGKDAEGLRFGESGKDGPRPRTYCLADSDEESSSAGSSDEEDPPEIPADKSLLPGAEGYVGGHRPSKIVRFVDKIAKSKYFQKATETEFIKKKMEEVSNTPLLLTVELQELQGTLAVNIPPPPTDRIWYGFRTPPHLVLKARPKLGEREVTLAHVTDWIEKKLDQEFQKIFVMPNMDDVWLPIMHSAMDTRSNVNLIDGTAADSRETDAKEAETSAACLD
ncbi:testis-expressed protein 2-like isoform X1 [Paramormyrops kingsleyae]|uniref:testis-expressed protein 2-like isoform X1 n=1 Tax=Paramormyrops kingsleyae TaxID=1676925 RepID=UPI003B96C0DB